MYGCREEDAMKQNIGASDQEGGDPRRGARFIKSEWIFGEGKKTEALKLNEPVNPLPQLNLSSFTILIS
jgi:hypothetical protein